MSSDKEKLPPDKIIPLTPFDVLHTACENFLARNPPYGCFDRFFAERFVEMYIEMSEDAEGVNREP